MEAPNIPLAGEPRPTLSVWSGMRCVQTEGEEGVQKAVWAAAGELVSYVPFAVLVRMLPVSNTRPRTGVL